MRNNLIFKAEFSWKIVFHLEMMMHLVRSNSLEPNFEQQRSNYEIKIHIYMNDSHMYELIIIIQKVSSASGYFFSVHETRKNI